MTDMKGQNLINKHMWSLEGGWQVLFEKTAHSADPWFFLLMLWRDWQVCLEVGGVCLILSAQKSVRNWKWLVHYSHCGDTAAVYISPDMQ